MKRNTANYKIIKIHMNESFEPFYTLELVHGYTYTEYPQLFIYDSGKRFNVIDIVTGLTLNFYSDLNCAERGLETCYNLLLDHKNEYPQKYIYNTKWRKDKLKELEK